MGADPAPVSPSLAVDAGEIRGATLKFGLQPTPLDTQPILALNAGAEYGPAKRWPVENFIAAAREIQKRANCIWLMLGGVAEAPSANQIESALRKSQPGLHARSINNLAGKTSLRELMALLKISHLLLSNDTGPMHVAAALGTPVVVPFGSTSPALTGPGLPGDRKHFLFQAQVACAPCFLRTCPIDFRCMKSITSEEVVQAVLDCLASPGSAQRQK